MLRVVFDCVRSVLQGHRWDCAFDSNGYGHFQQHVSQRVQASIGTVSPNTTGSTTPTQQDLLDILPRKRISVHLFVPTAAAAGHPAANARAGNADVHAVSGDIPEVARAHADKRPTPSVMQDAASILLDSLMNEQGDTATQWLRRLRPRRGGLSSTAATSASDLPAPAASASSSSACPFWTPAQRATAAKTGARPQARAMALARPRPWH